MRVKSRKEVTEDLREPDVVTKHACLKDFVGSDWDARVPMTLLRGALHESKRNRPVAGIATGRNKWWYSIDGLLPLKFVELAGSEEIVVVVNYFVASFLA